MHVSNCSPPKENCQLLSTLQATSPTASSTALFLDPLSSSSQPLTCFSIFSWVCPGFSPLLEIIRALPPHGPNHTQRVKTHRRLHVLALIPSSAGDSVAEKLPTYLRSEVALSPDFLHPQWTTGNHLTNLGVGCKVIQSCDVQPELVGLRELSEAGPQRHQLVTGDVGGQFQDLFTKRINKRCHVQTLVGPRPPPGAMPPTLPHLTSPHVVHTVVVQPETVGAVRPVDQQLKVLPNAVGKKKTGDRVRTDWSRLRAPLRPRPFSPHALSPLPCALLLFCYLLKHDTRLLFSQRPHFPAVATPAPRASVAGSGSQTPASPWQPQKPTSPSLPQAAG